MVDSAYYSTQTWDRQVRDSLKDRLIWSQIHNYVVKLVIWGMEQVLLPQQEPQAFLAKSQNSTASPYTDTEPTAVAQDDPRGLRGMGVWIILSLLSVASVVLYVVAQANYLLFHALVEGCAIVVAALIYVLATRTYQYSRNTTFLFLGIAYFHVAVLDFSHLLTYKGMGVFPAFGADIPTQLWIAGRFVEAVSLFIVLFLPREQINRRLTTIAYNLVTVCLLLSIMVFRVFPSCFVEGQGLTAFKVLSEYVIIFLLLGSAYTLHLRKDRSEQGALKAVRTAMVITAVSELAFTLYTDVYGIANMLGHILKVISYYRSAPGKPRNSFRG